MIIKFVKCFIIFFKLGSFKKSKLFVKGFLFKNLKVVYSLSAGSFVLNKNLSSYFNNSLVFNFVIIIIKNLVRVFYRRYRTVIRRRRVYRLVGFFRLSLLKYSVLNSTIIDGRFRLPLIFGSRFLYRSFKRDHWLFLLRSGVDKRVFLQNLNLYFDFLKKVVKYFPKRRLLFLNKVFICRLRATRNNFFLTFYFTNGKALVTTSAGLIGFKGKKKKTPLAAKKAAVFFSNKVFFVLNKLNVDIKNSFFIIKITGKSTSSVFKEALIGLRKNKFPCNLLMDTKPISHGNGVRLKKPRRV